MESEVVQNGDRTSPRCPKCGFVMCEQFDTQRINEHAELATPNGTYICYGCNISNEPKVSAAKHAFQLKSGSSSQCGYYDAERGSCHRLANDETHNVEPKVSAEAAGEGVPEPEYDVVGDGLYAELCQLFDERATKLHKVPGQFTHQLALVAADFTRRRLARVSPVTVDEGVPPDGVLAELRDVLHRRLFDQDGYSSIRFEHGCLILNFNLRAFEVHACSPDKARWEFDERPDDPDNPCSVCNQRMPINMMTAIFGTHYWCATPSKRAQETWEAICDETSRGGDKPSALIIQEALVAERLEARRTVDGAAENSEDQNSVLGASDHSQIVIPKDKTLEAERVRNLIVEKLRSMIRELEPVNESEKKGGFIGTSYEIGGIHDAITEIQSMTFE